MKMPIAAPARAAAPVPRAATPTAAPPSSVMNSRRSHSITSSARASSVGGTSRPSALAVFEVDDQLEFGRLHDRQVGGLGAFENAAGIDADLTVGIGNAGSIAHQAAGCGDTRGQDRSQESRGAPPARRVDAPVGEERIGCRRRARRLAARASVAKAASISLLVLALRTCELAARARGRRLQIVSYGCSACWIVWVDEQRQSARLGHQLVQQLQPLGPKFVLRKLTR